MEELINFWQKYNEILTNGAIIFMGLLIMLFLTKILRQIKRLNKSLGSITGNIQAYVDVILKEEEETEEEQQSPEMVPAQEEGERKEVLSAQEQKKMEDEKLFNAVLQEYFS
ncbi:MAG: hypothetical protein HFH41_07500 [Lachnospiraceae bacterium]|nr:hypothetical protein [Lachnospiraceae bacterium]